MSYKLNPHSQLFAKYLKLKTIFDKSDEGMSSKDIADELNRTKELRTLTGSPWTADNVRFARTKRKSLEKGRRDYEAWEDAKLQHLSEAEQERLENLPEPRNGFVWSTERFGETHLNWMEHPDHPQYKFAPNQWYEWVEGPMPEELPPEARAALQVLAD